MPSAVRRSRSSVPRKRGRPQPRPRSRQWWWLLLAIVLGLAVGYGFYQRQVHRYARRIYATLLAPHLTGRERTPLLAGYSVHGIDVSAYQGRVNWPLVAQNHVRFAFLKATEGVTLRDAQFQRNLREARRAGIFTGAYHYFQPNYGGREQAELFVRTAALQPGDLPPVLDVEAPEFHDVAQMRRNIQLWLRLVERHYGVRPILYSNYSFYRRYLAGHFDKYPLWLAHYEVARPALARHRWIIWQHSDESYIPGIRGTVDFNVWQGDFQSLRALRIPARRARAAAAR